MADKSRYTVTLPDHVAAAVESHAKLLGATPTEYASDVLRWWFGKGCPPVSHDEAALLAETLAKRITLQPDDLNIWTLRPKDRYTVTDDKVVEKLLGQLGVPNLFVQAAEHDEVRMSVAFDNHPTHWLQFDFFKGSDNPAGDGFALKAYPKMSVSRAEMLKKLEAEAKKMEASEKFEFSQIPILEKKDSGNQTPTKVHSSS